MIAEKERPVLELIRQIKSGSLDPRQLAAAERQACVMHLSAEGLSGPEIVQVLKRSDRTIARDRKAIQEANALQQDPRFAGEMAGVLINEAEACISHIRRAVRAGDTLVLSQPSNDGYSFLSLIRASGVLKRQVTLASLAFRSVSQAATSRVRSSALSMRRSRH